MLLPDCGSRVNTRIAERVNTRIAELGVAFQHSLLQPISDVGLNTSSLHPIATDISSSLLMAGSSGNSTICLPRGDRAPILSNAPVGYNHFVTFETLTTQ